MTWLRDTLNNKGARAKCLKWAYFALATSLHVLAKVTIRILFGDIEKYLDKFRTSARTRPFEAQRLGAEFFCKEHTKLLFNKLGILAFQNLLNYQICLETLKTIKSRTPQSLFQLYVISTRNNQLCLKARADVTPYLY